MSKKSAVREKMVADQKDDNNKTGQVSDVEKQPQEQVSCKNSAAGQKHQDDDDLGKVKVKKPRMYPVRCDFLHVKHTEGSFFAILLF